MKDRVSPQRKSRMKVAPSAAPLAPGELRFFRSLRRRIERGDWLEEYLSPEIVALRLGLSRRTILDLCGQADGFAGAVKPFPTKVLIPVTDVLLWLSRHRMMPDHEEVSDG